MKIILTRVKIKRHPLARNVVEVEVIRLPEFHVARISNGEAFLVMARMER